MNKKIFVAIPSANGFPYPDIFFNIFYSKLPEGYELVFNKDSICEGQVVHRARNDLVRRFLDSKCDYVLFCDDDNPPSVDTIKYLIETDQDIVSALVPLRGGGNAIGITLNGKAVTSIVDLPESFEIENCGGGCFLVKRDVMKEIFKETMGMPYQFITVDFVWNIKQEIKEMYTNQDKVPGREKNYLSKDGIITKMQGEVGEDLFFGITAKRLGFKIYANKNAKCIHYKRKPDYLSIQNI